MHAPFGHYVLPEFTERTTWGTRTLDPYSKLLEGRIVFLGTPLDDTAANDVIAQLIHLEYAAPDQDICLYINSPGGPVDAMTAIYDAMQVVACDVATTCIGQAGSTAAVLLAGGAPGKRAALPGARVLVQQPALAEPLHGQLSDLDVHARELMRQRDLLVDILARHSGRDRELVEASFERDLVLDATGAQAHGLVDHVIPGRKR